MLRGRDILYGAIVCVVSAGVAGVLFAKPHILGVLAPGAMTPGHEGFDCDNCHKSAPGTLRQEVQANVAHWLGYRATGAAFGNMPVDAQKCLHCHERKKDRHPIFRFREPRFMDVVNNHLDARTCLTCHSEHKGKRVSNNGVYCVNCHDRLAMKNDPLDVPHKTLVKENRWSTCLGCHDFHGNHERKTQKKLEDRFAVARIRAYLADGPSPYGDKLKEKAKKP